MGQSNMVSINNKIKESSHYKGIIGLVIFLIIIIFITLIKSYIENKTIEVNHYTIEDMQIPKSFNDMTIVHISDLHNEEFGENQEDLLETMETIKADVIVLTGDLIDTKNTDKDIDITMDFINGATSLAPTYYVTGNHDVWSSQYPELEKRLIDSGVVVLRDQVQEIIKNNESISLIGLDDPDSKDIPPSLSVSDRLSSLTSETEAYTILLAHRPEDFDIYVNEVNLVLSGHSHGGQICFPFIGALVAPDQGLFPKYSDGLYSKDGTKMIISRGLGTSVIPIRINNPPEIIVIKLKS